MSFPESVKIVEVGPRDGLQNEAADFDTATRVELINRLAENGLKCIESGAFVSPKWVPKMADTAEVLQAITQHENVDYPVLVPNMKGLEQALACHVQEIAIFGAASETFSKRNINCSITESLERFEPVCREAAASNMRIRGYISCVLGCPYEGEVDHDAVSRVADRLLEMGCYEISLGDTIGVGNPAAATSLIETLSKRIPVQQLAVHFHDTYGQAIANIYAALECGVTVVDSSVAGLGGCPYAPGAAGNVATENVVYLLNGLGLSHGVDLDKLIDTADFILGSLGKSPISQVSAAMLGKRKQAG